MPEDMQPPANFERRESAPPCALADFLRAMFQHQMVESLPENKRRREEMENHSPRPDVGKRQQESESHGQNIDKETGFH